LVETLKIIGLGVLAAVAYGIALDNVTARVCVEYFTIGHPRIIASESPTDLAFAWGVVATWWVGLPLGILMAAVCRLGDKDPKLRAVHLLRPVGRLLATMAVIALVAGIVGFVLFSNAYRWVGPTAALVPVAKHPTFMADWFAHLASYGSAFLGGPILALWASRSRVRNGKLAEPVPLSPLS